INQTMLKLKVVRSNFDCWPLDLLAKDLPEIGLPKMGTQYAEVQQ
nr:hypothetical protein [Tanacetum cinerariifolium]